MKHEELTHLAKNKELRQNNKKMKSSKTLNALLIGLLIGVALYSAINNGLSFWTFFPLLLAYIAFRNKNRKEN